LNVELEEVKTLVAPIGDFYRAEEYHQQCVSGPIRWANTASSRKHSFVSWRFFASLASNFGCVRLARLACSLLLASYRYYVRNGDYQPTPPEGWQAYFAARSDLTGVSAVPTTAIADSAAAAAADAAPVADAATATPTSPTTITTTTATAAASTEDDGIAKRARIEPKEDAAAETEAAAAVAAAAAPALSTTTAAE
jgi:hypothetical protein